MTEAEKAAVERAKKTIVSALDDRLPKVSLDFFLQYEAAGMPVSWRVVECEANEDTAKEHNPDQTCVEADFDRKHNGTVAVVVSIANSGESRTAPGFVRATVTDMGGTPRTVRRLGDLPMELHRPAPKGPKDLPAAVVA